MIKWTFFFNEGNVNSVVTAEEEDMRIMQELDTQGVLMIPGEKFDLYVNMSLVKCTAREVMNDNASGEQQVPIGNETDGPK